MQTVQLKVPPIKCEGCAEKIRTTLTRRRGVERVDGDPDRKELSVTFNPAELGDAEIRAAVADAGFLVG